MSQVLGQLPALTDPNVLVGSSNSDDAGVYKITNDIAVVFTTDFFTPIVDDPYSFGAIAAANSLSDVYAMGGRAIASLNMAMLPSDSKFFPYIRQIMQGGIDKMKEAGVSVIGGHTVKDKEPKFGYAVLGLIHPDKILDNAKAKPGDALILTKKIGTGIVSTGIKAGMCSNAVIAELTLSMAALNKRASEIMLGIGVSTATDITGFGLIGHLSEVLNASKCQSRLYSSRVPYFDEAVRLAERDIAPGGSLGNLKIYNPIIEWSKGVSDSEQVLMNDAQTSGGLLIFVPQERKDKLVGALQKENILAAHIGDVLSENIKSDKKIFVEK
ncbi:MAG: selenide, water dikinase SelD [Nitrospirae bacterium]|nr:selenide, water dikinase SelD [Nitrospirota bacterium]